MFQFLGFSLLGDNTALDNAPSNVDSIGQSILSHAIFDHFNLSRATNIAPSTNIPESWDYDTVLDAHLDGDLKAGNVDFLVSNIKEIQIRRAIKGTFNWITLKTIPINTAEDLVFTFTDWLNAYGVEYEYAFVPISEGGIEGSYITNSILSSFRGVFIGSADAIYRLMYDVDFNTVTRNQKVGVFEPLGRKYPIVVANGLLSYDSGTMSATVVNDSFDDDGKIDRFLTTQKIQGLKDFLSDHKPKILKDWNGNQWLVVVTDVPQVAYRQGTGGALPTVSFNWTEIGDPTNQNDLFEAGLVEGDDE